MSGSGADEEIVPDPPSRGEVHTNYDSQPKAIVVGACGCLFEADWMTGDRMVECIHGTHKIVAHHPRVAYTITQLTGEPDGTGTGSGAHDSE